MWTRKWLFIFLFFCVFFNWSDIFKVKKKKKKKFIHSSTSPNSHPLHVNHWSILCIYELLDLEDFLFFFFFKIPHTRGSILYLSFSVWLNLLSKKPSRSTTLLKMARLLFFWWIIYIYNILMNYIYVCVCIYIYIFIHSSINEHLGCSHILAIINNATVNLEMYISFQVNVFVFFK